MKILFICAGNVARSQIAEAIFNNLFKGKGVAISAGTKVVKENSNREGQKLKDKDMNIVEVMKEIGIDVSNCARKQVTPEIFNGVDKVIVINPSENIPEYVKQSSKVTFWEIPDPFNQNLDFARTVRNQLEISVSNLISAIP
ncbi:MAG: low molecular weight phosphatase family protein [Minisyncoccia bacterium]